MSARTDLAEDRVYEFGPFRLEARERVLRRGDEIVPLTPKAVEILLVLVEQPGRVVSRKELLARVWPNTFVEDGNLTVYISLLRRALGESSDESRYIETVPKRGYRFIADVRIDRCRADAPVVVAAHKEGQKPSAASSEAVAMAEVTIGQQDISVESGRIATVARQEVMDGQANRVRLRHRDAKQIALAASLAGLVLLLVIAFGFFRRTWPSAKPHLQVESLAVLPFKVMPEEQRWQTVGLGIADSIISKLSGLRQPAVRPTSAISRYDADADGAHVGRALGVETVLTGTIQKLNDRLRVSIQLISVSENRPLWAAHFEERVSDPLLAQESIAQRVATALAQELAADDSARLASQATRDTQALEEYLKGRYFWNRRTHDGLKRAAEHFRRAIELDPNYALAYVGLADCYNLLSLYSVPPTETFPKAKEAALKALELDPQSAEAHVSLAYVLFRYDWDWQGAEREFRRAIELNPNYPTAHHWYGEFLAAMGRFDQALAELQKARDLDPLSLPINTDIGEVYYYWRRYAEAEQAYKHALELDPNFVRAHFELGRLYERRGMRREALREYVLAQALSEGTPPEAIAEKVAQADWRTLSSSTLRSAEENKAQSRYVFGYTVALFCLRLNDTECAIKWLTHAYQNRDPSMPYIKVDPSFDALRTDPRFASLVKLMRLDGGP